MKSSPRILAASLITMMGSVAVLPAGGSMSAGGGIAGGITGGIGGGLLR